MKNLSNNKNRIVVIFLMLIVLSIGVKAVMGYPILELSAMKYTKIGMSEINYTFDGSAGIEYEKGMDGLNTLLVGLIDGSESAVMMVTVTDVSGNNNCYIDLNDLSASVNVRETPTSEPINSFYLEKEIVYLIKVSGSQIDALVLKNENNYALSAPDKSSKDKCWSAKQKATPISPGETYAAKTKKQWRNEGYSGELKRCGGIFSRCDTSLLMGTIDWGLDGEEYVHEERRECAALREVTTIHWKTYIKKEHDCRSSGGSGCNIDCWADCGPTTTPEFPPNPTGIKCTSLPSRMAWGQACTVAWQDGGCCPNPDYPYYRDSKCWHTT